MGLKGDDWRRLFANRYHVALGVVALLVTLGSFVQMRMINGERQRAEVIAMAAEQAALSQRIAFLATGLDLSRPGCVDPATCADLLAAAERMEANHDILSGTTSPPDIRRYLGPLEPIYAAGATAFRDEVEEFLDAACALARGASLGDVDREALISRIEHSGTNSIMQTHGLIVEVLEAEARRAIQLAGAASAVSWSLVLLTLTAISLRVFAPMAERLQTTINQMEDAQHAAEIAARDAARANRARGAFLKTASHEFKTPLNAIMATAEIIREGRDGAEKLLAEMSSAGDHLLSVLNTMLDTHRMEEGRLVLEQSPVRLRDELSAAARMAESLARQKGLDFTRRIDAREDFVALTDGARLRQVCTNLLDNAIRSAGGGGVCLSCTLDDRQQVPVLSITVSHSGEEAVARSLPDPGQADDDPLAEQLSTIGLGLDYTRTVIGLMGGSITHDGSGRTTTVDIPLVEAPGDTTGAAGGRTGDRIRVLISDDNRPNRMVADAMMSMLGGTTVTTENGQQAVEQAMREAFDLILMDIAMPVMNGIEATARIRSTPGPNRHAPIIAVTAHVAPEDVRSYLERGFDAVLHKPIRMAAMRDVIDRFAGAVPDAAETEIRA